MKPLGKLGLLLGAIGGCTLIGSVWAMAQRVRSFNAAELPVLWHIETRDAREFTFQALGNRTLSLTDDFLPSGRPAVRIRFGDAEKLIAVHPPAVRDHKDLSVYDEWLSVGVVAPVRGDSITIKPDQGERPRVVIVNRSTAGYDEETWGAVRIRDWLFDVIEATPDGALVARQMQFRDRRGRLPAEVDARRQLAAEGKPDPGPQVRLTTVEPIEERSWEWQAALFALPRSQISRYRYRTDAVQGSDDAPGMGWTLPVAGFSTLIVVAGATLIATSRVQRPARRITPPQPAA